MNKHAKAHQLTPEHWIIIVIGSAISLTMLIGLFIVATYKPPAAGEQNLAQNDQAVTAASEVLSNRIEPEPPQTSHSPTIATDPYTGLGWNVQDIERKWGSARGWYWVSRENVVGKSDEIVWMARNREMPDAQYMITGRPHNLQSVTTMVPIRKTDQAMDVVVKISGASIILGEVSNWSGDEVSEWVVNEMKAGRLAERSPKQYRGNQKLWLVGIPADDGVLLSLGVETTRN